MFESRSHPDRIFAAKRPQTNRAKSLKKHRIDPNQKARKKQIPRKHKKEAAPPDIPA
ncbi:hypothetical protein [Dickeya oryzae]